MQRDPSAAVIWSNSRDAPKVLPVTTTARLSPRRSSSFGNAATLPGPKITRSSRVKLNSQFGASTDLSSLSARLFRGRSSNSAQILAAGSSLAVPHWQLNLAHGDTGLQNLTSGAFSVSRSFLYAYHNQAGALAARLDLLDDEPFHLPLLTPFGEHVVELHRTIPVLLQETWSVIFSFAIVIPRRTDVQINSHGSRPGHQLYP